MTEALDKREALMDAASIFSESLTDAILEEQEVTDDMIIEAVRRGALARQLTPVFMGSAYKNKGVQPLLDGITELLPCPTDIENHALNMEADETSVLIATDKDKQLVALAFKLEDGPFGQLTYIRVYQG